MDQLPLGLPQAPQSPRRGRPPGARNKFAPDLARWVPHAFGMSQAQQLARFCMVTRKELAAVKAEAKALGVDPMLLAVSRKARVLSASAGIDRDRALAILMTAQVKLLEATTPKLAPLPAPEDPDKRPPATAFILPSADLQRLAPAAEASFDFIEDFPAEPGEVGQPKSDDPTQALDP